MQWVPIPMLPLLKLILPLLLLIWLKRRALITCCIVSTTSIRSLTHFNSATQQLNDSTFCNSSFHFHFNFGCRQAHSVFHVLVLPHCILGNFNFKSAILTEIRFDSKKTVCLIFPQPVLLLKSKVMNFQTFVLWILNDKKYKWCFFDPA